MGGGYGREDGQSPRRTGPWLQEEHNVCARRGKGVHRLESNVEAFCRGGRECRNAPRSNAADEEEKELQYRLMAREAREGAAADMEEEERRFQEELNAVARTGDGSRH